MAIQGYPHGGAPPDDGQTEARAEEQCSIFSRKSRNWSDCLVGQGFPQDRESPGDAELEEERNRIRAENRCADVYERDTILWTQCMASLGSSAGGTTREPVQDEDEPPRQASDAEDPSGSSSSPASAESSPSSSSGGPVHVRGYTRKDGTYVHSYTRHAPRR